MSTNCENCGAPLDATPAGNLVRCPYCGRVMREAPPLIAPHLPPGPHAPGPSPHGPAGAPRAVLAMAVAGVVALFVAIVASTTTSRVPSVSKSVSGASCPASFGSSLELDCTCGNEPPTGPVWGTDVYTTDSSFCAAAVHAGAAAGGGRVRARSAPGCATYAGTTRNGVTTHNWGSYGSSFYFVGHGSGTCSAAASGTSVAMPAQDRCPASYPVGTRQLECTCAADQFSGAVWGTDLYTTDSAFCPAALHAGAVPARGGRVKAEEAPGARGYQGSRRHGVSTSRWGSYPHSFRFLSTSADPPTPAAR